MLVADWVEEWIITGQSLKRWTVPRLASGKQSTSQTSLPVTMPTPEEMEYLKSRPWEKAELEGESVDWTSVAEKSGYGRAMRVVWDWNRQKRVTQDYRA